MSIISRALSSFTSNLSSLLTQDGKKVLNIVQVRFKFQDIFVPKPGKGYYRRIVHYEEHDKYTIKPIRTTNLAGRDPKTGRVVVGTLGGGIKWPYLWVDYLRTAPVNEPLIEKVIEIIPEPNRTAHLALVGQGDKLRYIIATENMKRGDIIVTSTEITRNAVRPNEGDAYPLGSLPMGTIICCVEKFAGKGGYYARAAGTYCTIVRKIGNRVIFTLPQKEEVSVHQECMAVVGRVSNKIHASIPIGSAWRLRHLGYCPRSGLWQRKTGRHGRKVRAPPPVKDFDVPPEPLPPLYKLTIDSKPFHYE